MVKQRIFNNHKYDRLIATLSKSAAVTRAKELKSNVGKDYISVRVVRAAKKDRGKANYEVYFRMKTPRGKNKCLKK